MENETIEALRQGGPDAFNTLFLAYGGKVYRFSYSYLKSREEAEEIVQEVFIKVWRTRDSLDANGSLEGLIFTIAYRLILNRIRKIRNEKHCKAHLVAHGRETGNNVEEFINETDIKNAARQAINSLPERRRAIFQMIREHHMTHQQVADHFHISIKTVEAQMTEALKYLRKRLIAPLIAAIAALFFI